MKRFTLILSLLVAMVTTAMAQITSLDELSNDKYYTLESSRAFLMYDATVNDSKIISTNGNSTPVAVKVKNSANPNQQFQIKQIDGSYYLYSVAAGKYLCEGNTFSAEPTHALTIRETTDATYKWYLQIGSNGLNSQDAGQTDEGIVVNGWTEEDPGNRYKIVDTESVENIAAIRLTGANAFNLGRAYTATTPSRGGWAVKDDHSQFCSTNDAGKGTTTDKTDANQQFAILSTNGVDFYLYSVGAKKFVNKDRSLTQLPGDAIEFTAASGDNAGRFRVNFKNIANSYINIGGSNQMTIDSWSTIDAGNAIEFLEVATFDPTEALAEMNSGENALRTIIEELTTNYLNLEGNAVGQYSDVAAIRTAVETAQAVLDATTSTNADFLAQVDILNALKLPSINLPVANKMYVLRCNHEGRIVYVGADNKVYYGNSEYNKNNSNAIWVFEAGEAEGTFKMKSLHTQSYMPTLKNSTSVILAETGADVTILKSSNVTGAVMLEAGNTGIGLHANSNPVIGYTNGAGANHYFFDEIDVPAHTLTVGTAGWSTLILGFNATIPTAEGFKAYTVASVEDGYVKLAEATGVLGANTPIIVNAPADNYDFAYTTEAATVTESGLQGTLYNKHIAEEAYVLGVVNEQVGLYKAKYNVSTDTTNDGTEEAPAVTYEAWKNNANKAYLPAAAGSANAASYSFRFGEGTTGVENVVVENEVKAIYDLTGRRVETITEPGIYIVNGVKKLVR